MAEKSTFVKLDRNIIGWRWYKDGNTARVFFHLILIANIKNHDFEGVTIHRGELASSYSHLAAELGLSLKCVRTAIRHLCRTGEVACTSYSKFTVFTVLSYDRYQQNGHGVGHDSGQAKGKRGAGKGQQSKNDKKDTNVSKNEKNPVPAPPTGGGPKEWEIQRELPDNLIGQFESEEQFQSWLDGEGYDPH